MFPLIKKIVGQNFFLFALVRLARSCRGLVWSFGRNRAIKSYLSNHDVKKLQLGAGPNAIEGWLNTDLMPRSRSTVSLDARKQFNFENSTFNYIFSEHQIELLTYGQAQSMLAECHRVLKTGGRIRIATPAMDALIGLHVPEKSPVQQRYIQWITDQYLPEIDTYQAAFVTNNAFRYWGHQFIYDQVTLQSALERAGFTEVSRQQPGESDSPDLQGVERHGQAVGDEEMGRFETMVLEALKPEL